MRTNWLAGAAVAALVLTALPATGAAAAAADANLLANASFEQGSAPDGLTGWAPWSTRSAQWFTSSTEKVSDGAKSLHLNDDSKDYGGGMRSAKMPVTERTTYEVNLAAYKVSGSFSVWTYFYDTAGKQVDASWQTVTTASNEWERSFLEFSSPATATSASIMIYSGNAPQVEAYVDDVYFGLPGQSGHQPPPEPLPQDRILEQSENFEYLGTPVTTKIPSQAAQGVEDGRHVSYQVFKGNPSSGYPATFAVTDIATGEQLRTCEVTGAEHVRNLSAATDGRVYWASYYDSQLWRYDPATKKCSSLGKIAEGESIDQAFGVSPGADGAMYLGAYPDSRLFEVDPITDEIEFLRSIDPGAEYIHSIAYYEPTDTLFVGSGGKVPQVWMIADGGRGKQTLVADEALAPGLNEGTEFVSRMDIVGNRVFAQVGLRMLILDADTGKVVHWDPTQTRFFFGHHLIQGPTAATAIFSTGGDLLSYDLSANTFSSTGIDIGGYLSNGVVDSTSGKPLLYGTSASGVFVADVTTGELLSNNKIEFAQPTLIQKVFEGPDDSIWTSGYMVGLSKIDKTGQQHGDTVAKGQFESAVARDGKLYLGGYGNARFDVLDPATFDPSSSSTIRTLFNGAAEGQDRPMGMAYNPDRDEVYMGSVAGYGKTQGGLAIWEGATGKHVWLTDAIGADENIVSAAYNPKDGLVYLGSTVDGGLGAVPSGNTAGKLIVFDPETRRVVKSVDPVGTGREGITGLMVDAKGLVWGVAEEALFAYDPATGAAKVKGTVGSRYGSGTTWSYGNVMTSNADGRIYVTAGGRLSVHDPKTGATTRLATRINQSAVDEAGDLYVSSGAMLFRYNVERTVPACTATVSGPVTDGLKVGADEVICLDGARVDDGISVASGGSLVLDGATVHGGLTAASAANVVLRDSAVRGAVSITGTTGAFVVAGNDVRGSVACSENPSAPDSEGSPNAITGASSGQCSGL